MNNIKLPDFVYLVWGYTGEYSSTEQWAVAAYLDKELAEQHCKILNSYFTEDPIKYSEVDEVVTKIIDSGWDKYCRIKSLDGVSYSVYEIPFALHPDLYLEKHGS